MEQARKIGGPVLELGCGTGRVLLSMAGWGLEVVGIDQSPDMLDRARSRALASGLAPRVELRQTDMCSFALERKFPCIVAPLNALMHHLDDESFSACLERVASHLAPGGRFLFDLSMPRPEFLAEASAPEGVEVRRFQVRGQRWCQRERHRFDPASRISRVRYEFHPETGQEQAYTCELDLRFYGPDDWPPLFQAAGLRILQLFGNFQSSPFSPEEAVVQVGIAKEL